MSVAGRIRSPSFLDDPRLRALFAALDGDGEELRVVGGAVRNHLMGETIVEVDLTTTAQPGEVARRAQAAGLKCVPTGLAHGTQTIVVDHAPFEVTTLREDVSTNGRHAIVRFGRDFRADALRRDFTFNALSADASGAIYDYAGGVADIDRRRVRFIGDPAQRIREDYLRILRFFRFHAAYGVGEPDAEALVAIAQARAGLATLSRERVRAEFLKLLEAPRAPQVVALMSAWGVLTPVAGGVCAPVRLSALADRLGPEADSVLRLAALAVLTREDADRLRVDLRLSNGEYDRLARAVDARAALHGAAAPEDGRLREYLYGRGAQPLADAMALRAAEARDPAPWLAARARAGATPTPRFPVAGADLLKRGLAPGPRIGAALKRIEAAWIAAGLPDDASEIVAAVLKRP